MLMVCDGSGDERPARRRHWPEVEKRRMVAEVEASGRSVAEIARRYRLASSVLGRWCARYGTKMPPATVPSFVPVTVAASATETKEPDGPRCGEARIEILLSHGRRLVADEGIAPSRLRLLIAAIEGA
jgi:transposase